MSNRAATGSKEGLADLQRGFQQPIGSPVAMLATLAWLGLSIALADELACPALEKGAVGICVEECSAHSDCHLDLLRSLAAPYEASVWASPASSAATWLDFLLKEGPHEVRMAAATCAPRGSVSIVTCALFV